MTLNFFFNQDSGFNSLLKKLNLDSVYSELAPNLSQLKIQIKTQNNFHRNLSSSGAVFFEIQNYSLIHSEKNKEIFIWKNPNSEEILELKKILEFKPDLQFVILAHQGLSPEKIYSFLLDVGVHSSQVSFLISNDIVKSFWWSKDYFKNNKILKSSLIKMLIVDKDFVSTSDPQNKNQFFKIPFAILFIFKWFLAPFEQIKLFAGQLKYSQLTVLRRFAELLSLIVYLISSLKHIYYLAILAWGYSKRFTIPAFFMTRHTFLMARFKSYGLVVDFINFLHRNFVFITNKLKVILIRSLFATRHLILMSVFKIFGVLVDFRNLVDRFLRIHSVRVIYFLRHIVLMTLFKSFGLMVDLYFMLLFFFTRVLPWPIFKIYWFSEFQYHKRIKKWFTLQSRS